MQKKQVAVLVLIEDEDGGISLDVFGEEDSGIYGVAKLFLDNLDDLLKKAKEKKEGPK